jgi:hypothetical protein
MYSKEKMKEYNKIYYMKNKEKIKKKNRERYIAKPLPWEKKLIFNRNEPISLFLEEK